MRKKERKSTKHSDLKFYICFILMALTFITINLISDIKLNFAGYEIIANAFLYPFIFLYSTMITKNYGREKALIAILLTTLLETGIYIIINLVSTPNVESVTITGNVVAFLTSQVTMVFLYHSIEKDNKLSGKAGLYVLYVFCILIETMITLAIFNIEPYINFEHLYTTVCAIQAFVAFAIVYIQYLFEKEKRKIA